MYELFRRAISFLLVGFLSNHGRRAYIINRSGGTGSAASSCSLSFSEQCCLLECMCVFQGGHGTLGEDMLCLIWGQGINCEARQGKAGPCNLSRVLQWRGQCWQRGRRSRRSGWGFEWRRATVAGSSKRCSRTRGPRIRWIPTAPAARTRTGPAPHRPAVRPRTGTCLGIWAQSWTTVRVSQMTCSWSLVEPRTVRSLLNGSTSSVKMGQYGASSTKSVLVNCSSITSPKSVG